MFVVKISMMLNSNTNSIASGDGTDKGLVGNSIDWFGEAFRVNLVDFGIWLVNGIFDVLNPFVTWGCKLVVVWCIVTVYCTGDKKSLALGMKCFLIYLLFLMIRSALI
ncbi:MULTISPECIES: hypothetical protein [unclassified Lacrimispora]|uniref:hypothetical protein n=1 Tax=unclassified Lacrimispora TaxID=2719232 RepID=UPI00376FBAE8